MRWLSCFGVHSEQEEPTEVSSSSSSSSPLKGQHAAHTTATQLADAASQKLTWDAVGAKELACTVECYVLTQDGKVQLSPCADACQHDVLSQLLMHQHSNAVVLEEVKARGAWSGTVNMQPLNQHAADHVDHMNVLDTFMENMKGVDNILMTSRQFMYNVATDDLVPSASQVTHAVTRFSRASMPNLLGPVSSDINSASTYATGTALHTSELRDSHPTHHNSGSSMRTARSGLHDAMLATINSRPKTSAMLAGLLQGPNSGLLSSSSKVHQPGSPTSSHLHRSPTCSAPNSPNSTAPPQRSKSAFLPQFDFDSIELESSADLQLQKRTSVTETSRRPPRMSFSSHDLGSSSSNVCRPSTQPTQPCTTAIDAAEGQPLTGHAAAIAELHASIASGSRCHTGKLQLHDGEPLMAAVINVGVQGENAQGLVGSKEEPCQPEAQGTPAAQQPPASQFAHEQQQQQQARVLEVCVRAIRHPQSQEEALLVVRRDVTTRSIVEGLLVELTENQLSMVSQMLPRHVIEALSHNKSAPAGPPSDIGQLARRHQAISLLFMDIVGFTSMSKELEPCLVLAFLNELFSRFDALVDHHGVHKVETAGDCYIVSAGVVQAGPDGFLHILESHDPVDSARKVLTFAKDMLLAAQQVCMPHDNSPCRIRIGIHTGNCTSGVIGSRLVKFGLFGDAMNTASRMESTSLPGRIQISSATFALLRKYDQWSPRQVEVKGKGQMQTYLWVPPPEEEWKAAAKALELLLQQKLQGAELQGPTTPDAEAKGSAMAADGGFDFSRRRKAVIRNSLGARRFSLAPLLEAANWSNIASGSPVLMRTHPSIDVSTRSGSAGQAALPHKNDECDEHFLAIQEASVEGSSEAPSFRSASLHSTRCSRDYLSASQAPMDSCGSSRGQLETVDEAAVGSIPMHGASQGQCMLGNGAPSSRGASPTSHNSMSPGSSFISRQRARVCHSLDVAACGARAQAQFAVSLSSSQAAAAAASASSSASSNRGCSTPQLSPFAAPAAATAVAAAKPWLGASSRRPGRSPTFHYLAPGPAATPNGNCQPAPVPAHLHGGALARAVSWNGIPAAGAVMGQPFPKQPTTGPPVDVSSSTLYSLSRQGSFSKHGSVSRQGSFTAASRLSNVSRMATAPQLLTYKSASSSAVAAAARFGLQDGGPSDKEPSHATH